MVYIKKMLTVMGGMMFSCSVFSQQVELGRITVQATALEEGGCWERIDIERLPFFSVEEMVDYFSCVDLKKRAPLGVQQDVSLQGSGYEDNFINIQGVTVNDPQTGHFNLDLPLTYADVEQIQVLRNSQQINFILREPEKEGKMWRLCWGEHGLWKGIVSVNFPYGENGKNRLSFQHSRSKGERQDTDFKIYTLLLHSVWEEQGNKIEFIAASKKKDFGANSFYSSSYPHEEEHTDQRFFLFRVKDEKIGSGLTHRLYLRRHKDKFILDRHNPSFYTNYHTTYVYGIRSGIDFYPEVCAGIEVRREEIDSTNLGEHQRLKRGIWWHIKNRRWGRLIWEMKGGVDYRDKWGYIENVFLGIKHPAGDKWIVKGTFWQFARPPSFTELYYVSPANKGNPELKVQKIGGVEIGGGYTNNRNVSFTVGMFAKRQRNVIDWVKETETAPWQARNTGKIYTYGVNSSFYVELNQKLIQDWSLKYTCLFLDKEKPYRFSKYIFDYPSHKLVSKIRFKFNEEVDLTLIGNFCELKQGGGYFTVDFKWKRIIEENSRKIEWFVEGVNIFNQDFYEVGWIKGTGRWLKAGVSYIF